MGAGSGTGVAGARPFLRCAAFFAGATVRCVGTCAIASGALGASAVEASFASCAGTCDVASGALDASVVGASLTAVAASSPMALGVSGVGDALLDS
jgi:hypothetical protein